MKNSVNLFLGCLFLVLAMLVGTNSFSAPGVGEDPVKLEASAMMADCSVTAVASTASESILLAPAIVSPGSAEIVQSAEKPAFNASALLVESCASASIKRSFTEPGRRQCADRYMAVLADKLKKPGRANYGTVLPVKTRLL